MLALQVPPTAIGSDCQFLISAHSALGAYSARHIQASLQTIAQLTGRGPGRAERLAGRLLASLDYGQVDEIMSGNLLEYLQSIVRQAGQIGAAVHQQYVSYPVNQALSA